MNTDFSQNKETIKKELSLELTTKSTYMGIWVHILVPFLLIIVDKLSLLLANVIFFTIAYTRALLPFEYHCSRK